MTAEVAPADARRPFVDALLAREGAATHPLLTVLAGAPGQRFGVWLGVRRRARGALRYKLYQEVAPGGTAAVTAWARAALGPAEAEGIAPTLVGFPVGEEGVEVYGMVRSSRPASLHLLFREAGVAGALPGVLRALALMAARPSHEVAGALRLGCSVQAGTGALTLIDDEPGCNTKRSGLTQ